MAVGVGDDLCCKATATGAESAPQDRFGQLLFAESGDCRKHWSGNIPQPCELKWLSSRRKFTSTSVRMFFAIVLLRMYRVRESTFARSKSCLVTRSEELVVGRIEKVKLTIANFKMLNVTARCESGITH